MICQFRYEPSKEQKCQIKPCVLQLRTLIDDDILPDLAQLIDLQFLTAQETFYSAGEEALLK